MKQHFTNSISIMIVFVWFKIFFLCSRDMKFFFTYCLKKHTNFSGADINTPCRKQTSRSAPLHLAAIAGELRTLKLLLEGDQAADVRALDVFKATPLHKAAEYGHAEVAALLLKQE